MKNLSGPIGLVLVVGILILAVIGVGSAANSWTVEFVNGTHYFCPDGRGLVMINATGTKDNPNLQATFSCKSRPFDVDFEGPGLMEEDDLYDRLGGKMRMASGPLKFVTKGFGIVLAENGRIVQMYEASLFGVQTLWKTKEKSGP